MNKSKVVILMLCLAFCAMAQLPFTTVSGTLLNVDGQTNFNGTLTISWPAHDVRGTGQRLSEGRMQVEVFNGAVSVALVPTDKWFNVGSGQDAKYTVLYQSQGTPVVSYWVIPTSSSAVALSAVAVSTGGGSSSNASVSQWGGVFAASSAGAPSAPYSHNVTAQAGNFGTDFAFTNHWNDIAWVQVGQNYAIRQTGLIKTISFSYGNPGAFGNQHTHLYFILCRPSVSMTAWNQIPGDCPVIAKSEDLINKVTAGAVNTITLATPIYARKGDYYGFEEQGTFNTSTGGQIDDRFHYETANCGSSSHCYIMTTVSSSGIQPLTNGWNVSWTTTTGGVGVGTDNAVPVQVTMAQAPVFVALGDSIIAGNTRLAGLNATVGGASSATFPDPTSDMSYWISQATGWTYQNMGIGGQRTDQIDARITDCTSLKPQFCILEGGVNDIAQSVSVATAEANWTDMLTKVQAAGIKPICLLVLPWTLATNTQAGQVDTLNAWLNGQCEAYGGYTVDARPYVGQFRTGGATDNLWDIRPEYMSVADNLKIHFSTLGYQAIARAILDKLGITTGQPVNRKNGVYYLKQQSLTASVASTSMNCTTDLYWAPAKCEHGLYRLSIYASPMTAAATSSVSVSVTFKDPGVPGSSGNQYTITTSSLDLSALTNKLEESHVVALDGLTVPTVSTTYSGTATYQVYVALERID